jgi:hypothetical protein
MIMLGRAWRKPNVAPEPAALAEEAPPVAKRRRLPVRCGEGEASRLGQEADILDQAQAAANNSPLAPRDSERVRRIDDASKILHYCILGNHFWMYLSRKTSYRIRRKTYSLLPTCTTY